MDTLKVKQVLMTKHKAWKGDRVGLYIRVPANVAEELRNEARQKQQHFNDIALKRLQTNGK